MGKMFAYKILFLVNFYVTLCIYYRSGFLFTSIILNARYVQAVFEGDNYTVHIFITQKNKIFQIAKIFRFNKYIY